MHYFDYHITDRVPQLFLVNSIIMLVCALLSFMLANPPMAKTCLLVRWLKKRIYKDSEIDVKTLSFGASHTVSKHENGNVRRAMPREKSFTFINHSNNTVNKEKSSGTGEGISRHDSGNINNLKLSQHDSKTTTKGQNED